MLKPERILVEKAREFETPVAAVTWLIEKGIIDLKRCRVWAMRVHYVTLIGTGMPKMDALTSTAIEYCVSEKTVEEALYKFKDM